MFNIGFVETSDLVNKVSPLFVS